MLQSRLNLYFVSQFNLTQLKPIPFNLMNRNVFNPITCSVSNLISYPTRRLLHKSSPLMWSMGLNSTKKQPFAWFKSCGISFTYKERALLDGCAGFQDIHTIMSHPLEWDQLNLNPLKKAKMRESMYIGPKSVTHMRQEMLSVENWSQWFECYFQLFLEGHPLFKQCNGSVINETDGFQSRMESEIEPLEPKMNENHPCSMPFQPVIDPMMSVFVPSILMMPNEYELILNAIRKGRKWINLQGPRGCGKSTCLLEMKDCLSDNDQLVIWYFDLTPTDPFNRMGPLNRMEPLNRMDLLNQMEPSNEMDLKVLSIIEKSLVDSFGTRVPLFFQHDYPELKHRMPRSCSESIVSILLDCCEAMNKKVVIMLDHGEWMPSQVKMRFGKLIESMLSTKAKWIQSIITTEVAVEQEMGQGSIQELGQEQTKESLEKEHTNPIRTIFLQSNSIPFAKTNVTWKGRFTPTIIENLLELYLSHARFSMNGKKESSQVIYNLTNGIPWLVEAVINEKKDNQSWKSAAIQVARHDSQVKRSLQMGQLNSTVWQGFKNRFLQLGIGERNQSLIGSDFSSVNSLMNHPLLMMVGNEWLPNCFISEQAIYYDIGMNQRFKKRPEIELSWLTWTQVVEDFLHYVFLEETKMSQLEHEQEQIEQVDTKYPISGMEPFIIGWKGEILWADNQFKSHALLPGLNVNQKDLLQHHVIPWFEGKHHSNVSRIELNQSERKEGREEVKYENVTFLAATREIEPQRVLTQTGCIELRSLP